MGTWDDDEGNFGLIYSFLNIRCFPPTGVQLMYKGAGRKESRPPGERSRGRSRRKSAAFSISQAPPRAQTLRESETETD